jgi:hypothetical protein
MTTQEFATTALTARTPEDVLAMVPVVLGFVPEESVAMLTFGAATPFHARVDLPGRADGAVVEADVEEPVEEEVGEVVDQLLAPARLHGVRQVLFVLYTADELLARTTARALVRAFERHGIEVIEALRADGCRWYAATGRRAGIPPWGVPYDVSAHPFLVRAVLDGRVTHRSREELRGTVATDPEAVAGVVVALAELTGDPRAEGAADPAWAGELVVRHVAAGTRPSDAEVGRLLRGMLDLDVRDATWAPLRRATARDHVRFWSDIVRRAPAPLLTGPAAVLALAAWLAGHGALAWCALDRCAEADPDDSLATLVAEVLQRAVPPDAWPEPAAP